MSIVFYILDFSAVGRVVSLQCNKEDCEMCAESTDLVSTGATLESPQRTLERHYPFMDVVFSSKNVYFYFMFVCFAYCMCVHHMSPPQMPEEGVRAPGSEVEEGYEPLCGCREAFLGPL